MRNSLVNWKLRLLPFFAVLGPGLITAVADNDAGGIATYSVAASIYGMASQYLVIPTTIILFVTQEIGARIAIVTGKGLGDLIREKFGVRVAVFLFLFYMIVNFGVILQNISGLKAAIQLFEMPYLPWQAMLIFICSLLIFAVVQFNYKRLQRIFLTMILFYIAYVVSAFMAQPDWGEAVQESFIFPRKINVMDIQYWFTLIAVLGTTITAWGQFFIQSYIVDKGLTIEQLPKERVEIYLGAFVTNFFSWMIALAVTFTLFKYGIKADSAYTAALAIKPIASNFTAILFAVGLFGASLLGLVIVPMATSYVFGEMFGFGRSLNHSLGQGVGFYSFFIIQMVLGLIVVLFPSINLFELTLYADYLNGMMLPIIFYFLLKFSTDKELMGKYVTAGISKALLTFAMIAIFISIIVTLGGKLL
ncbi:MAG TPA: Nramp family divalent metal transporter [Rickettsiales bacterium]|nr:Nramp family divalent metal transporter [Rickettsiales bacterium]